MTGLDRATLGESERRTLERLVGLLEERLGEELVSVWLYGSRARGERPHDESDVDVIVVTQKGMDDWDLVDRALVEAAGAEGANPFWFSIQLFEPEWIADRRRIESFYLREVDRDKIVLAGTP
jgi:predicted nucleotidyltransferase